MPIYSYKALDPEKSCSYCKKGFDIRQELSEQPLKNCPRCSVAVKKDFSGFSIGGSKTGFDRKAKEKGFHKLKKVDKGKYEKLY